ncbi:hypothetical protein CK500_11935 [Halorubrum salipaludis]|uniref:t-SNARE coiled-coil homology domain-containing protein n=1 Tax=Halorubrum salipaludis TaxID=2032630 RepID=A0A2A2FDU0_9EURY|nr:hypothetical protein [Halorubrum salipaludis]PAU82837.1 hypothetical protein CK500_11935 [Halorubrum salipaludis]
MSDLDPTDDGDSAAAAAEADADAVADTAEAAVAAAAAEADVGREELLKRAIVALAESEGIDVPDAEEVAAIQARLDDLDAEVDEKVEDLRERFVELYRDLESKAPADHAHEETAERLDAVAADLDAVADRLDEIEAEAAATATVGEAVEETIDALDDRLARVESRLDEVGDGDEIDELRDRTEALDDRTQDLDGRVDEIDEKLSRVASAVVRVRRRLEAAERDRADRERLDALTAAANRGGVRKAKCTNCGETVDIGLLTAPECPHCGRGFEELEPNPGFLGTSRLVVGDRPALGGEVHGDAGGTADAAGGGTADSPGGDVSTREGDGGGEP